MFFGAVGLTSELIAPPCGVFAVVEFAFVFVFQKRFTVSMKPTIRKCYARFLINLLITLIFS